MSDILYSSYGERIETKEPTTIFLDRERQDEKVWSKSDLKMIDQEMIVTSRVYDN